mgnify:CR=1 FL=1
MSHAPFAETPAPPYYAVIFSSTRTEGDHGYEATANRMAELAKEQPGYLGIESARNADGFGVSVSYWRSLDAIAAWRRDAEHRIAQETGKRIWYSHYELRIARVERAYAMSETTA